MVHPQYRKHFQSGRTWTVIISVVGYICETDTFASNKRINEISRAIFYVLKMRGAYCFTMAAIITQDLDHQKFYGIMEKQFW